MVNLKILKDINDRISERRSYGIRSTDVGIDPTRQTTWLHWSNGLGGWTIFPNYVQRMRDRGAFGDSIGIDANEILVPYREDIVREMLPMLAPLPLYTNSFEFKEFERKVLLEARERYTPSANRGMGFLAVGSKAMLDQAPRDATHKLIFDFLYEKLIEIMIEEGIDPEDQCLHPAVIPPSNIPDDLDYNWEWDLLTHPYGNHTPSACVGSVGEYTNWVPTT